MSFKKIQPEEIQENTFKIIGKDWMLVTAGTKENFNTMTASWGALGVIWRKNAAICFVRPTRYTYEFMENNEYYTLSIYEEQYRPQLTLCGTKSGRDIDKVKETGFTPAFAECGAPYFEEAKLVLVCKKMYFDDFKPENFLDETIDGLYHENDYHRIFVGEILEVLKKE